MLLTILFILLLLGFVGKLIGLAIKCAWGLLKILLYIVFFPVLLVILLCSGLLVIAFPLLIIAGVILLVKALI